jgi:uncharacterized protein
MNTIPSPCIKKCGIPQNSIYCSGCLRTGQEIADWRKLNDTQKLIILEKLNDRKSQT